MILLLRLYYEYLKVGLFAIGGGMATIPFLQTLADRTGWFTQLDILNMLAVSESTPGPIGVNMASYVGFQMAGVPGSIVATLGLATPSIIVILIIAQFLKRFRDNKYVMAAMYGLRAASAALIASAAISVLESTLMNLQTVEIPLFAGLQLEIPQIVESGGLFQWKEIALTAILLVLTNWKPLKKLHPAVFLAASAVGGIVFSFAGA